MMVSVWVEAVALVITSIFIIIITSSTKAKTNDNTNNGNHGYRTKHVTIAHGIMLEGGLPVACDPALLMDVDKGKPPAIQRNC